MLKSTKHVFWEALIITIAVFLIGLYFGILLETKNSDKISHFYIKSEINLVDGLALAQNMDDFNLSCNSVFENNRALADRVYEEAKLLEVYEESGKLTEGMKQLHVKYDLLRTLIWIGSSKELGKCKDYNLVVYLYAYETDDLAVMANQNVWSKILGDLKKERSDVLLVPIAADQELSSLIAMKERYKIERLPAIVINNKEIIYEVESVDSLKPYLN